MKQDAYIPALLHSSGCDLGEPRAGRGLRDARGRHLRWWAPIRACRRSTRTRCPISPTVTASGTTRSSAPIPGSTCGSPAPTRSIVLPGRRILPPGPRDGIVVNLPEHRLYYYPKPQAATMQPVVITYPVSIGKMDWRTPLGETHVIAKIKQPARGTRRSRCARSTQAQRRPAAARWCRRGRTTRSASSPCVWPPATAPT